MLLRTDTQSWVSCRASSFRGGIGRLAALSGAVLSGALESGAPARSPLFWLRTVDPAETSRRFRHGKRRRAMHSLLTPLLGLWLVGPSVSIRVVGDDGAGSTRAERERLHGLLALRLLDAGMAVAPPGSPVDAAIELWISAGRFDIRAEARGARASRSARAAPGTDELALSHGVVLALTAVLPPEAAGRSLAPAHALALEVRGSNAGAPADALRLALVSQLLIRGWVLTGERGPERPSLCVHDAGELVTVAYGPPGLPCGSPVFFARPADAPDDAATRERVVGAAVALLDRADSPADSPAEPPQLPAGAFAGEAREALGPGVARPRRVAADEPAPARLGVELRAATGLALRAGLFERAAVVVDPAVRLGLRLGRAPGVAGQLGGVLIPAREDRSNRALDGFVGAGLAWSRRVARAWEIEVGGLVGAHVHTFRAVAPAAAPWGELAFAAAWRTRRGLGIHAGIHPAASWTAGWIHYIPDDRPGAVPGDVRRFQRSGWSVTFSVAVSHGWRLR